MKLMPVQQAFETLDSLGLAYEVIDSTHYVPGIPKNILRLNGVVKYYSLPIPVDYQSTHYQTIRISC